MNPRWHKYDIPDGMECGARVKQGQFKGLICGKFARHRDMTLAEDALEHYVCDQHRDEAPAKELERVRVFDDIEWRKVGHDVDDNDIFFKPASVVRRYTAEEYHGYADQLADVVFDHRPERVSRGHFLDITMPIVDNVKVLA